MGFSWTVRGMRLLLLLRCALYSGVCRWSGHCVCVDNVCDDLFWGCVEATRRARVWDVRTPRHVPKGEALSARKPTGGVNAGRRVACLQWVCGVSLFVRLDHTQTLDFATAACVGV